ncbi:Uncharacterised protein [Serratia quinivorans]|uniref:hypothetical protein n=1 Tax=Serratia quinivorans TaxID=137545 RepID=UPI002178F8AE|nr:hypothetical protein [Serratia quinivorans]CAI1853436.1 Uncharacterised protein [Serratia quinivorans]
MKKYFDWSINSDVIFDDSYESQGVVGGYTGFNKGNDSSFIMNSPGNTLVLRAEVTYLKQPFALQWPETYYKDGIDLITIENGKLFFIINTHEGSHIPDVTIGNSSTNINPSIIRNSTYNTVNIKIYDEFCIMGHANISMENIKFNLFSACNLNITPTGKLNFLGNVDLDLKENSNLHINIIDTFNIKNNNNKICLSEQSISNMQANTVLFSEDVCESLLIYAKDNSHFNFKSRDTLFNGLLAVAEDAAVISFYADSYDIIQITNTVFSISNGRAEIHFSPRSEGQSFFDFSDSSIAYSEGMIDFITINGINNGVFIIDNIGNDIQFNAALSKGLITINGVPAKKEQLVNRYIDNNLSISLADDNIVANIKLVSSLCSATTKISYRCDTVLNLTNSKGKPLYNQQVDLSIVGSLHITSNNPVFSDNNGNVNIVTTGTRNPGNGITPSGTLRASVGGYINKDIRLQ